MKSAFRNPKSEISGQGLLEAIVAITIIGSGLVGVINLALVNKSGSESGEERLLATNLAREGVEIIRNRRDANWLARSAWDSGLYSGTDYTATPFLNVTITTPWTLNFTPNAITHNYARLWRAGGVYFQSILNPPPGAALTAYRRLLFLDPICQDKTIRTSGAACPGGNPKVGIRVRSQVQWTSKGRHSLTAEERIFNWR